VKKWIVVVLGAAVIGLALLLVKENSDKIASQTKLRDFQLKMDSLSNEKLSVTLDLENQITALERALEESQARFDGYVADTNAEIEALNAKMQGEAQTYELELKGKASEIQLKNSEIVAAETRSKEDASKHEAMVKEKNAAIKDLGNQLEQASARYSKLLEKSQALETGAARAEKRVTALQTANDRLERQNKHLLEVVQIRAETPTAPTPADLITD
jgi:chromosome segregation ATPase